MEEMPEKPSYAWILDSLEWIEPFEVKGRLHLFDVEDELIHVIPESVSDKDALERYYEPLIWLPKDEDKQLWRVIKQLVSETC